MKLNLNSQQILPIMFVSGLLIISLMSNSFLTSAFGQQERQFSAMLTGSNEVSPVNTTASGIANFTLSPDGKSLHYTLSAECIFT